jgi:hypothetical protein
MHQQNYPIHTSISAEIPLYKVITPPPPLTLFNCLSPTSGHSQLATKFAIPRYLQDISSRSLFRYIFSSAYPAVIHTRTNFSTRKPTYSMYSNIPSWGESLCALESTISIKLPYITPPKTYFPSRMGRYGYRLK